MACFSPQTRRRCSQDIGLADMEKTLENFMDCEGTRDLVALLRPLKASTTWKSAPRPVLLARFSFLASGFLQKAPHARISGPLLVNALTKCHRKQPCIFAEKVDTTILELSGVIRAHLTKYWDVKTDDKKHDCPRTSFTS